MNYYADFCGKHSIQKGIHSQEPAVSHASFSLQQTSWLYKQVKSLTHQDKYNVLMSTLQGKVTVHHYNIDIIHCIDYTEYFKLSVNQYSYYPYQ